MFYMSEKVFREKMRKVRLKNESKARKLELRETKNKYKQKKKIQTSKLITAFLMILMLLNCLAIEAYSCYAMLVLQDLSALYVLIGAACTTVIGEVLAYVIYSAKSFKETKAEKDLEFEYHKLQIQQTESFSQTDNDDEPVG